VAPQSGPLRWALVGAGKIAGAFAAALKLSDKHVIAAVASSEKARADSFIAKHDCAGATAYGTYAEAFADPGVDVIYIATPHESHARLSIEASTAGKHVLVEKPAGVNAAEVMAMQEAAFEAGMFWMEAFMYRCNPQTARIVEIVKSGEIGKVRLVDASFGFPAPDQLERRLLNPALAGGGIMDVGLYPVSFARLIAGAARGQGFADPVKISALGTLGETGVDEVAGATLQFDGGMIAQVKTSLSVLPMNDAYVYGTLGRIYVPQPWQPGASTNGVSRITVKPYLGDLREELIETGALYLNEAEAVREAIEAGQREAEPMSWADTLGNLRALDFWRSRLKLTYPFEQEDESFRAPNGRKQLSTARRQDPRDVRVPGISKPLSRLVMGCDNQTALPHAFAMFDDYFERGGNIFDTAHLYGGGIMEHLLGQWMRLRGVRDEVVVIAKGAHTPDCRPEVIRPQLEESLDRLGTDHAEIYFLHRDDASIPIGEWVDALNEVHDEGMIGIFGGSNWTLDRVKAANVDAAARGKNGFGAISNNFSLAEMVNPVWPGVLGANTPDWRAWLEETQTPLFPWSSQARGFFTNASGPDKLDNPELSNAWYSDANFSRKARAQELAAQKGVDPVTIAAAFVLHQRFPCFPLIGPRSIAETRGSFRALAVSLSPEEVTWLDRG
jgi:predicted dehydrogenase/aryl-alcohol dehydrogenase-like predicted oxidoreductase